MNNINRKYSEILTRAKVELKNESYWRKGGFFKEYDINAYLVLSGNSTCMCGMGAAIQGNKDIFLMSTEDYESGCYARVTTRDYLEFRSWIDKKVNSFYPEFSSFYAFNDDPKTTFEDVIKMFDQLIYIAINEGI